MCGILGIVQPRSPVCALSHALAATRIIRHRGPDDEGLLAWSLGDPAPTPYRTAESATGTAERAAEDEPGLRASVLFGHRRLSILDLSEAGHQPMSDASGKLWTVFNGEIYNYIEIRHELAALGHSFRTGTDTEVLLAAYRQWGHEAWPRFNGMFAFLILDLERQELVAVRDRFGVKPLYRYRGPERMLAFASEIKQFGGMPGWSGGLDDLRVAGFLRTGEIEYDEGTLYRQVDQVAPGTHQTIDLRSGQPSEPVRWYRFAPQGFFGTYAEALEKFGELWESAVRLRMRSDVLVGTCLSGGLDSSVVVDTSTRILAGSRRMGTFSAVFPGEPIDESKFAHVIAQFNQTEHHEVTPMVEEFWQRLDELVWLHDGPFMAGSIFAGWKVYQLAREMGCIVLLDGQGGDEALGGYHSLVGSLLAGHVTRMQIGSAWREALAFRKLTGASWAKLGGLCADALVPRHLTHALRKRAHGSAQWDRYLVPARTPQDPMEVVESRIGLSRRTAQLLVGRGLPVLLKWADRNSMGHSVESRMPFMDYRLMEFLIGLPDEFKWRDGRTKRIVRDGPAKGLPELIRERGDKLGYEAPDRRWLLSDHGERLRQKVELAVDASHGMVSSSVRDLAKRAESLSPPELRFVFRVATYGVWVAAIEKQPEPAPVMAHA